MMKHPKQALCSSWTRNLGEAPTLVRRLCKLRSLHSNMLLKSPTYCRVRNCSFFLLSFHWMVSNRKQSVLLTTSGFSYLPFSFGNRTTKRWDKPAKTLFWRYCRNIAVKSGITKIRRKYLCVKLQELHVISATKSGRGIEISQNNIYDSPAISAWILSSLRCKATATKNTFWKEWWYFTHDNMDL